MALGPTRARWGIVVLLTVVAGRPALAQDEMPPPYVPPPVPEVPPPDPLTVSMLSTPRTCCASPEPRHLDVGNQQFDASTEGLRSYLESIRSKDARLYTELDPELKRLEERRTTAIAVLVAGAAIGAASTVYAIAGRDDCPAPSVNDPNFAASTAAWGACNDRNMTKTATFALIGLGAAAAGVFAAAAIAPGRSDLLDFVNHHNRLNPEPLRLQLGYDPGHGYAYGGAALSF